MNEARLPGVPLHFLTRPSILSEAKRFMVFQRVTEDGAKWYIEDAALDFPNPQLRLGFGDSLSRRPVRGGLFVKRFRYWFANVALILALIALSVMTFLWWRSFRCEDEVECRFSTPHLGGRFEVQSNRGSLLPTFYVTRYPASWESRPWLLGDFQITLNEHADSPINRYIDWRFAWLGISQQGWLHGGFGAALYPFRGADVDYRAGVEPPQDYRWRFLFPHWFVAALCVLYPGSRTIRRVRRRVRNPNACPRSGYDCRATPQRCPECGEVTVSPAG